MATPAILEPAAVRLMTKFPLWCELFYSMECVITKEVATLCTNGKKILVNPAYWAKLDAVYRPAALAHEVTHKMLHHCTRGRDFLEPWGNIAADVVVNTLLAANGFVLHPAWVPAVPKYAGWTFEAVYHDIIRDLQPQPSPAQGKAQQGSGKLAKDVDPSVPDEYGGASMDVIKREGSPEQLERIEQEVEQAVQQAVITAKAMGASPLGIESAMETARVVHSERWYDHLRRYMQEMSQAEMNWAKINRRMAALYKVVAPTQYTEQLGEVVIFRDTSGSCYLAAEQSKFNSHVASILAEAKPRKVHVVDFDADVQAHRELDPGELEFAAPPVGGGGTSFVPLFPWIEEQGIEPAVVIVLTDMYGWFPSEAPEYPVIWASTSKGERAPFGEVIELG